MAIPARTGVWFSLSLGFAAALPMPSAADTTPEVARIPPAAAEAPSPDLGDPKISTREPDAENAKKPRLRFRTTDGTCACTCASGGMSEADIRKAQEERERKGG